MSEQAVDPDEVIVGVLGPVEVTAGPTQRSITARRERVLLARLALDVGHAVDAADLIDAIWNEAPPATCQETLHTYVFRLRRRVGRERLVRQPGGYALVDTVTDVALFRREVAGAQMVTEAIERAAMLRQALRRWRGTPYADLGDHPRATAARRGLEEWRCGAVDAFLEARLELEPVALVLPDLEQWCAEQPTRERVVGLLMVALYRAGRQADALAAGARLRAALIDRFGLQPAPTIADLERRILHHDPTLLGPPEASPYPISEAARVAAAGC